MKNKKLIPFLTILVIIVVVASFIAGRLFRQGVGPLGLFELLGGGFSLVTDILPAEELPKTPSEVTGLFVERQDNAIFIQASQPNQNPDGVEVGSVEDVGTGPKIEVFVTGETLIYRDTTQLPDERPSSEHNPPIQQTVMAGSLEDLIDSQTYITVWGRKSGDRVVADVLVYSYLTAIEGP